jgi:predicted ATPase
MSTVTTSLVSPIMVGRHAESKALSDALARVMAGAPTTLLVGGEAGVGKSRLVHVVVEQARAAGARVLLGGCVELDGGGIPFAPLIDMFRTLAGDLQTDELDMLLGSARAEIGRLVPELDDGRAHPPSAERDPSRILELILGVIGRMAAENPLMLVFEDLQWADPATLDLIALLVAGASGRRRLLLVFTVRSDELHRAHPFRRVAARWEQQRAVERLELRRLDSREVAAQIEAILGERPDGELVEFIFERSEGIPLFVEELLGTVRDRGVDRDYLPPSLRDVVLARAERLSENAQHVLHVVSAAARWAPERLLAIVGGLSEGELNAALREAVQHQLLVVDPSGRGYGFRHALARAAVHDDLLPGERTRLHNAYAEALEDSAELAGPDLDVTSMLAHHWLAAHHLPRALRASVRAGEAAAIASAPSAAQRHYELALELWTRVPDAERQAGIDHPRLLRAAAEAAYYSGAADRALALVDQALAELSTDALADVDAEAPARVDAGGTLELRAMLLARRAAILSDIGRDAEGIAVLEQAVSLLPAELPSQGGAHVLAALARAMARVDQLGRAGELAQQALSTAQAAGAIEDEFDAQISLGYSTVCLGSVEAGLTLVREAGEKASQAGLMWIVTRAFINLSDLLLMLGRYDEAVSTVDEGLALVEQAGLARTIGAFLRGNKGEALLRLGRLEEAMSVAATGIEAPGVFVGTLLLVRVQVQVLTGRHAEARVDFREARRHLRSSSAQWGLDLAAVEAELARSGGELDAARDILERALAPEQAGEGQRYRWPVLSLAMRIEAERALAARDQDGRASVDDRRASRLRGRRRTMVIWRSCAPSMRGCARLTRSRPGSTRSRAAGP